MKIKVTKVCEDGLESEYFEVTEETKRKVAIEIGNFVKNAKKIYVTNGKN